MDSVSGCGPIGHSPTAPGAQAVRCPQTGGCLVQSNVGFQVRIEAVAHHGAPEPVPDPL
jgi:hypothetical protein